MSEGLGSPTFYKWGATSFWWCKCTNWNYQDKKKCSRCGVKRAYGWTLANDPAIAAAQAEQASNASARDWWRDASSTPVVGTVPPGAPATNALSPLAADGASSAAPAGSGVASSAVASPEVEELKATIKRNEAIIATLGSNSPSVVAALAEEVSAAKRAITESKPVEQQIKSCAEAIQRHTEKLEKAQEKLREAQEGIKKEQEEIAELNETSRRLNVTLAQKPPTAIATMQNAEASLGKVVSDLQASNFIPTQTLEKLKASFADSLLKVYAEAVQAAQTLPVDGGENPGANSLKRSASNPTLSPNKARAAVKVDDDIMRRVRLKSKLPASAALVPRNDASVNLAASFENVALPQVFPMDSPSPLGAPSGPAEARGE